MDIFNFTFDSLKNIVSVESLQTLGGFIAIPLVYYAIECFFGFRFFRIKCAITGFSAGVSGGLLLSTAMGASEGVHVALAVVLGILFAWLSYKVYKFGVFFTTAITGFALGLAIGGATAGLIVAVIVGIVAVILTKPAIIVSSAFSGGFGLGTCIFAMANYQNDTLAYVVGLVLCVAGVLIQFKTTKQL